MIIPEELKGCVVRTKLQAKITNFDKLDWVRKEFDTDIDVIYEAGNPVLVLIFENAADCTAFKLKYGEDYV